MAIKMEEPFFSRDDLLQEALVYLWKEETQRRCVRNYLQNQINRGRSVDSRKHRAELIAFSTSHDFTGQDRKITLAFCRRRGCESPQLIGVKSGQCFNNDGGAQPSRL